MLNQFIINKKLNQLWVQFSLAFAGVVLLAVISIFLVGELLKPESLEELEQEVQAILGEDLRSQSQQLLTLWLITLITLGGTTVTVAGVWMARRMTAPLDELARGASAIGRRDLAHRVHPKGSSEMIELANSFNLMASELEESEKLRQNLLSDVAHELRTPLTILQGNLRAILDDVYEMDKGEIARLYDQTRHLIGLVDELRELAQAEANQLSLELQKVNIAELLESSATIFAPLADGKNLQLEVIATEPGLTIDADKDRLTQVLNNLLSNALRHTPDDGCVTIRSSCNNGQASISVVDSGEGIESQHLPYIFDRFYRADPSRGRTSGGTGLGLALVRAIVEAHHGSVSVTSPGLGFGSVFTISLPRG